MPAQAEAAASRSMQNRTFTVSFQALPVALRVTTATEKDKVKPEANESHLQRPCFQKGHILEYEG